MCKNKNTPSVFPTWICRVLALTLAYLSQQATDVDSKSLYIAEDWDRLKLNTVHCGECTVYLTYFLNVNSEPFLGKTKEQPVVREVLRSCT